LKIDSRQQRNALRPTAPIRAKGLSALIAETMMATLAEKIGRVSANLERATHVAEFIEVARFIALGRGAEQMAIRASASSRVVEAIKAATDAGTTGGWGAPLALFALLANAFISSLSRTSAFDAMLPSMIQLPLRTQVAAASATLTGGPISEASIKPAGRASLTATSLDASKAAAFIAVSAELMKAGGPAASGLLERELRSAVGRATDATFLPVLTSGAQSFSSSGATALAVRQDLRTALLAVTTGAASMLFWIVTPTIAKAWSVLPDSAGAAAFPNARADGGEIGGVPIVVSDSATAGEIVLADAAQIAAGAEGLRLDSSNEATIQMDSSPDSPVLATSNYQSLWQLNLVGLRCERFIGAKPLRSDAVAKITGAAYTGNSPA
jgi:HK97 family phage major capsid protein